MTDIILKILGEIISKIPFPSKQQEKKANNSSVSVIVNNFPQKNSDINSYKIGELFFLNKLENIYTEDVIKKIAVKAVYTNGKVASDIPLEFSIENTYDPVLKSTNSEGIAYFENIKFYEEGKYKLCVKYGKEYNYSEVIEVKLNKICLEFLEQPSNTNSKELLNRIALKAKYMSGTKAERVLVCIGINVENICFSGIKERITDENGIVYFDNLSFIKTGVYKLKATCKGTYVYSEPFHVYPPGVCIDFEKYKAGSKEETEAFLTALLEKKPQGDIIKYNGEEF